MQHAITDQREAATARRLDAMMLALRRPDPRRCAWLEAADAGQIAGRWLASHPSERHGMICSNAEFSEMLTYKRHCFGKLAVGLYAQWNVSSYRNSPFRTP